MDVHAACQLNAGIAAIFVVASISSRSIGSRSIGSRSISSSSIGSRSIGSRSIGSRSIGSSYTLQLERFNAIADTENVRWKKRHSTGTNADVYAADADGADS